MLTIRLIKQLSGEYDCDLVRRLKCERQGIREVTNLDKCPGLLELSMAHNQVASVSGLHTLVKLERLDLSFNEVASLEGIEGLKALQYLDLRDNGIASMEVLHPLRELHQLRTLYLKGSGTSCSPNRVCQAEDFVGKLRDMLPQLQFLDGCSLELLAAMGDSEDQTKLAPSAEYTQPLEPQSWTQDEDMLLPSEGPRPDPAACEFIRAAVQECKKLNEQCETLTADTFGT